MPRASRNICSTSLVHANERAKLSFQRSRTGFLIVILLDAFWV
jgi:hypothetical protein